MNQGVNLLFKKMDYLQAELDYKTELLSKIDVEFNKKINKLTSDSPDLDTIVNESGDRVNVPTVTALSDGEVKLPDQENRDIYRKITKITHPDKVENSYLNDMYIKASKYYEIGDSINLCLVATQLGVEIDDDVESDIIERIEDIKSRIQLLENSYTWRWFHSKTESERNKVILDFIKKLIIKN